MRRSFTRLPLIITLLAAAPALCSAKHENFSSELRRAQRHVQAHTVKSAVASFDEKKKVPCQPKNNDEAVYSDLRGNFGKALRHHSSGFIDACAYKSMVCALASGKPCVFDDIIFGIGFNKLVSPQASLAFSLTGNDGWINSITAAPHFSSQEAAAEMVELYWSALLRDVPFNMYGIDVLAAAAINELNTLVDYTGPKIDGQVLPQTLLRGNTVSDLSGPYISQFLYRNIPYGSTTIGPEQRVPLPGLLNDFLTNFNDWLLVINGGTTGDSIGYDPTRHFIRNGRDLAEFVHFDTPGQIGFSAALICNSFGAQALDPANPYLDNPSQSGFVSYGINHLQAMLSAAIDEALKAAWYQKWQVHRRLRPEEYGFYLQQQLVDGSYLSIPDQLANSLAAHRTFNTFGSFFLPQAYPEGAPAHPSYPAGHAATIGAAVTVLKAFYREDFVIPNPVQPNPYNTALEPFPGFLTLGDELNKLASNVALGRDFAGVHYRSDSWQGMLLGEKVAIDVINNFAYLYNEDFDGFTLTKFNGETITVGAKRKP